MDETWIKLYRSLIDWCWFKDANTLQVFIYLLINANIEDKGFQKIVVKRGQLVTSYANISLATGLSLRNVRTAINHLKSTGEVTSKTYSKFSLFTIEKYALYQAVPTSKVTSSRQATDKQVTSNRQASDNNIRIKESKNIRKEEYREGDINAPAREEVQAYVREQGLRMDANAFFDNYAAVGWIDGNGNPITDWKAKCRKWSRGESNFKKKESVYASDASYDLSDFHTRAIGLNILDGII